MLIFCFDHVLQTELDSAVFHALSYHTVSTLRLYFVCLNLQIQNQYVPVMLVLGLKAKFCGLGLAIGWPWPWDFGLGKKFKAKILADYKIHH